MHLADNSNLDRQNKYVKVCPQDDLANNFLKQFGYWHQDYATDEHMIPFVRSAKQTISVKSVRFWHKNLVLLTDGYPYHLIPYCGTKGIGGTPGKDLTFQSVANLVLTCQERIGNLTFNKLPNLFHC